MRRTLLVSLLALLAAAPAVRADEIVVLRATGDSVAEQTAELERDLGFDADRRFVRAIRGFAADLTPAQVAELRDDREVALIVADRPVHASAAVPALAGEIVPPGIRRATVAASSTTVRQAADGTVAVADTGVDLQHPDLNVVAGTDCTGTGTYDDVHGHGTHVAGTVGARNNGSGVTGVAPGTKIAAVKVLDDSGSGSTSTVLCGIEWILANRVALDIHVANFSLGGSGSISTCAGDPEHSGYCRLVTAGVAPVVAAGNDGVDFAAAPAEIPAAYPEVLTVAAMSDTDGLPGAAGSASSCSSDDRYASFSNYATPAAAAAHLNRRYFFVKTCDRSQLWSTIEFC